MSVATDGARRNSGAAAECNSEVRKIAADTRAVEKAYNLTRVMNVMGVQRLLAAMRV
jgi:hypothetical protein